LEHGVEALNCGDANLTDLVQLVGLKVLDIVKLGEKALLFRRTEILELFKSLTPQVAAVHEEQQSARTRVFD
jgi:hypothetical protein